MDLGAGVRLHLGFLRQSVLLVPRFDCLVRWYCVDAGGSASRCVTAAVCRCKGEGQWRQWHAAV
jgi:hypothetical protein